MDALTIDRALVLYRVPESCPELADRLDRVREQLFSRALEDALEREGSKDHDLLCIRSLRVGVQLPARLGEAALLAGWTQALTSAIRERITAGDPRQVIRYSSPLAALIDMGRSLARGDRRRAWAWQALGLCRADELDSASASAHAFARALLARPSVLVAALVGVSALPDPAARWLSSLALTTWLELADAALRGHGLDPVSRERLRIAIMPKRESTSADPKREHAASVAKAESHPRWGSAKIDRALQGSAILDLVDALIRVGIHDPMTRPITEVLEVLALLDAAPLAARRLLTKLVRDPKPGSRSRASDERGDDRSRDRSRDRGRNRSDDRGRDRARRAHPRAIHPEAWSDEPRDDRAHATSEWAGLLLTLTIVRREQLWASIDALAHANHLSSRALLHEFARSLVPEQVAANDPALLAFVGLPPDAEPPRLGLALDVRGLLAEPRAKLVDALEQCLPIREHRPARGEALLTWLIHRSGELRGEAGWLELRLRASEVDTDIRRAGLDFDPDWLPELGVIVRFVYV